MYAHLAGNVVDFVMEADPRGVFGSPFVDDFVYTEVEGVTNGWIYGGETFTAPPPPPVVIPQSITPRQIRLQLTAMGLRQQVEDWVATQPLATKDWWEFSLSYERNNQMLIDAAAHFGLTSGQLDQLFIEASKL